MQIEKFLKFCPLPGLLLMLIGRSACKKDSYQRGVFDVLALLWAMLGLCVIISDYINNNNNNNKKPKPCFKFNDCDCDCGDEPESVPYDSPAPNEEL